MNRQVHRGLVALQSKGDVEQAVSLISQAVQLDEKCEFAYETLGTIEVWVNYNLCTKVSS